MQVSVETTSELGRRMVVEIPEQRVQALMITRLNAIAKDVKMDGFRPGKVPAHVIKRQFGLKIREEVVNELFQSSLDDALKQNEIRPVTQIEIQSYGFDDGMRYEACFDVMPEFVVMPFEAMELVRYLPEVSERDVDDAIERLRHVHETWHREDRPAQLGDRVIVNFEGWSGDQSVTEGRVENYPVHLGGPEKIPGFDDHLTGQSANSHIEFEAKFPEDYPKPELAEKIVQFRVDLIRVESRQIPGLDAEFVKTLGVADGEIESLKREVKDRLQQEISEFARDKTKTGVMDALVAANPITIPESLVINELDAAIEALNKKSGQKNADLDETEARKAYEPMARRRVHLSLLLGQIVEVYSIRVEKRRVDERVADLASGYEKPAEVIAWYKNNKEAYESMERLVHEETIVDYILNKARIREVIMTARDVGVTAPVSPVNTADATYA